MTLEEALAGKEIPASIAAQLQLIDIDYWSFDEKLAAGQLVVQRELAAEVVEIFAEIYAHRFPIEKMIPISKYAWSDDASMADNNSSAFNYRFITSGARLSWHAYGRAIDINPRLNPYVKGELILPPGAVYDPCISGTLTEGDAVVRAFRKRGWDWGGLWQSLKDWHHFEKPL